jgi:murein DD-endopeptidase MepM/ murein hydrolase activator NlpD
VKRGRHLPSPARAGLMQRLQGLAALVVLVAALVLTGLPPGESPAAPMCPPDTVGDIHPTPTTTPGSDTPTTTLIPPTTSTTMAPDTTTTTVPPDTTTTVPRPTTTVPPDTTTTVPRPTTTVPPDTTTTMVPPDTTTTTVPADTTTTTTMPTSSTTTTVPPDTTTTTAPPDTTTTTVPQSSATAVITTPTSLQAMTVEPTGPVSETPVALAQENTTTTSPRSAGGAVSSQEACQPFEYVMSWPLAGPADYISPFGAPRDGGARLHKGSDLAAPRMTPVVAVADATVMRVQQEVGTTDCCWVALRHHDGWQSYYIHLNNDLYGTDDGQGIGVRPDLAVGSEVAAGEVIGWLGDSGNAEETVVHLHFELRTPQGVAVDAWPSLARVQPARGIAELEPDWPYRDDDGAPTEALIATMLTRGVLLPPCGDDLTRFCPDGLATVEFIHAATALLATTDRTLVEGIKSPTPDELSSDFTDPRHQAELLGCEPRECLASGMSLTQLARLADTEAEQSVDTDPGIDVLGLGPTAMPVNDTVGSAQGRLAALTECVPTLEAGSFMGRADALRLLIKWIEEIHPSQCLMPTYVAEPPLQIVSRSELAVGRVNAAIEGGALVQMPIVSLDAGVVSTGDELENTDQVAIVLGHTGPENEAPAADSQPPPLDEVEPLVPPERGPRARPPGRPPMAEEDQDPNANRMQWALRSVRAPGTIESRVKRSSRRSIPNRSQPGHIGSSRSLRRDVLVEPE